MTLNTVEDIENVMYDIKVYSKPQKPDLNLPAYMTTNLLKVKNDQDTTLCILLDEDKYIISPISSMDIRLKEGTNSLEYYLIHNGIKSSLNTADIVVDTVLPSINNVDIQYTDEYIRIIADISEYCTAIAINGLTINENLMYSNEIVHFLEKSNELEQISISLQDSFGNKSEYIIQLEE